MRNLVHRTLAARAVTSARKRKLARLAQTPEVWGLRCPEWTRPKELLPLEEASPPLHCAALSRPTREAKRRVKLNCMHNNPVKREPVNSPGDWPWSS